MKVLVAEDDALIRDGVVEVLEGEGYLVETAADGEAAVQAFESVAPDFVILDIMMPKMNGYDVCKRIRAKNAEVPIIFLSAKSEEIDKVVGLELGADDYINKPFGIKEFLARIRAVSRRCLTRRPPTASFEMRDLLIFPDELRARRGDEAIDLSLRDVKILQMLCDNQGKVLDRDALFNECWGLSYFPNSRTLDQHISQLRKKVEHNPKEPEIIKTVHGVGYRYDG